MSGNRGPDSGGEQAAGVPSSIQYGVPSLLLTAIWVEHPSLPTDDDTFTYPAGDIGEMDINLNGGILSFLIRSDDLRNRDFSQVLAEWACT